MEVKRCLEKLSGAAARTGDLKEKVEKELQIVQNTEEL